MRKGEIYSIDTDFEGERLVDDVTLLEDVRKWSKKVLVYSPLLRANILVWRLDITN